jgi:FkbM family methyltransferase
MIIFNGITENNKGINISSIYENEITVLAKIIDGYTGLCSYATPMKLYPGVNYFFTHFVNVYHRRFEVWNEDETKLYLKLDVRDNASPNLEILDKFNKLKNFKYDNQKDYDAALPLYEIFCNNLYNKEHCEINPGDVVVDIGGHLGFFSYFAICKGADKVYCFEPSKDCVRTIQNNFRFSNLILEELAVTLFNGEITFYYNPYSSMQSSIYTPNIGNRIICKSVNLNDYIIKNNIQKINFLKIDCEGAEYEIIESLSEEYIANNIEKICIEYHFNINNKIYSMLEKLKRCGLQIQDQGGGEVINSELGVFYAWK